MVVRELITLLGFRTDMAGAVAYEAVLKQLTRDASAAATGMVAAIRGATMALTGLTVAGLAGIARAGDDMTAALNRLETATGSASEATEVYERLYDISRVTGVAISEGARSFQRFSMAAKDLGHTNEETLTVVRAIQQAALLSGSTTQEAISASIQLGQALASNVLQGDELRSLTENMPMLARLLAKEMGVAYSDFRKLAREGKFTADQVFPALVRASAEIDKRFATMTPTIALSWRRLMVVVSRTLADIDRYMGLSSAIAKLLNQLANIVEGWRKQADTIKLVIYYLGGAEGILRLLASAFMAAFGVTVLRAIMGVNAALLITIGRMALILSAFLAATLVIEDLMVWFMGGRSLIGRWLGPWEEFKEKIKGLWEALPEMITNAIISSAAILYAKLEELGAKIKTWINDVANHIEARIKQAWAAFWREAGLIGRAFRPQEGDPQGAPTWNGLLFDGPPGRFERRPWANGWRDLIPDSSPDWLKRLLGKPDAPPPVQAPADGDPVTPFRGIPSLSSLLPIMPPTGPPVPASAMVPSGAAPQVTATQTNQITNQINITATGPSAPEVGAATQTAVERAGAALVPQTEGFARALGQAVPRTEAAAQ